MRLVVPDALKVLLVDDWEAVTKNNQVRVSLQPPNHLASPASAVLLSHHFCRASPFFFSAVSWSHYLEVPPSRKYWMNSSNMFMIIPHQSTVPPVSPSLRTMSSEAVLVHTSLRDPQVVLPTIVSGLQVYFDKALGSNLLYRFERPQYAEIRKRYVTGPTVQVNQEREMSAIYGAEHLLRMIGLSSV
jgi:mortality factor 4-like protein 1